jgi:hypothetical protein
LLLEVIRITSNTRNTPLGVEVGVVSPTAKGFQTWLSKQKPQWRNRVKAVLEESGYELEGKFLTVEEANRRAVSNPDLIEKLRRAIIRDGKIQIIRCMLS